MSKNSIENSVSGEGLKGRIKRLEEAKRQYFETGEPLMEDYEYDAEEMIVAREAPGAEVLGAVGAPPEENVVKLPVPMPSLDKVKPGEPSFGRWLQKQEGKMLWSAKLDGISALWIPSEGRLYNRGDGTMGSDLTRFVPIIKGLAASSKKSSGHTLIRGETPNKSSSSLIRGEILILRSEAPPEAKIIRSYVNGVLHRKEGEPLPPKGLLRFVAYRDLTEALPRFGEPTKSANLGSNKSMEEQFADLVKAGYEVPSHGFFEINNSNRASVEQTMIDIYQEERKRGLYEIDGIVLTSATAKPEKPKATNPKDTVAFKMPLAEQTAETVVQTVEWNLSRGGLLIPRVLINPVTIGGATISKVTGHNAKFIVEAGLGTGAKVLIRRSGDVIPIIDTVQVPVEPQLPPAGTFKWDGVHILPAKAGGDAAKQLLHSIKVLGIKGAGEAAAQELVEAGYLTIFDINRAPETQIQTLIGTSSGKKLKEAISAAVTNATLVQQILSCPDLPAGLGASRIEAFVTAGARFDGAAPEGFGSATWASLKDARRSIEAWIAQFPAKAKPMTQASGPRVLKGTICVTGFRFDPATKSRLEAAGWIIKDTMSKECKFLVVPGLPHESSKVAQALKYGIPIVSRDSFIRDN